MLKLDICSTGNSLSKLWPTRSIAFNFVQLIPKTPCTNLSICPSYRRIWRVFELIVEVFSIAENRTKSVLFSVFFSLAFFYSFSSPMFAHRHPLFSLGHILPQLKVSEFSCCEVLMSLWCRAHRHVVISKWFFVPNRKTARTMQTRHS